SRKNEAIDVKKHLEKEVPTQKRSAQQFEKKKTQVDYLANCEATQAWIPCVDSMKKKDQAAIV
ncbi:unnamed protein product, partial [Ilex paraguariensis]